MKLLVATRSKHKLAEIRRILGDIPGIDLVDLNAAGVPESAVEATLEPYETFEENARSKAAYFREQTGLTTVADDSGLEVKALGWAPGVRSKRFSPGSSTGHARDLANNAYLVERLSNVPVEERDARYVCVAALATEGGVRLFRGESHGTIVDEPAGDDGFGYDPHFLDPTTGRTFAELTPDQKNEISHRGRAFRALAEHLKWVTPSARPSRSG